MPESEAVEATEVETPEEVTEETTEETQDFEAMYTDSQDALARARVVIAHYGGADLDVDTELSFVLTDGKGEFTYRPAVVPATEVAPSSSPTPVRPRRASSSRSTAAPTKSPEQILTDMDVDEFAEWLKKPENQMVQVDHGDKLWR